MKSFQAKYTITTSAFICVLVCSKVSRCGGWKSTSIRNTILRNMPGTTLEWEMKRNGREYRKPVGMQGNPLLRRCFALSECCGGGSWHGKSRIGKNLKKWWLGILRKWKRWVWKPFGELSEIFLNLLRVSIYKLTLFENK